MAKDDRNTSRWLKTCDDSSKLLDLEVALRDAEMMAKVTSTIVEDATMRSRAPGDEDHPSEQLVWSIYQTEAKVSALVEAYYKAFNSTVAKEEGKDAQCGS